MLKVGQALRFRLPIRAQLGHASNLCPPDPKLASFFHLSALFTPLPPRYLALPLVFLSGNPTAPNPRPPPSAASALVLSFQLLLCACLRVSASESHPRVSHPFHHGLDRGIELCAYLSVFASLRGIRILRCPEPARPHLLN
jgi:hypothetical protein